MSSWADQPNRAVAFLRCPAPTNVTTIPNFSLLSYPTTSFVSFSSSSIYPPLPILSPTSRRLHPCYNVFASSQEPGSVMPVIVQGHYRQEVRCRKYADISRQCVRVVVSYKRPKDVLYFTCARRGARRLDIGTWADSNDIMIRAKRSARPCWNKTLGLTYFNVSG